tara:strand:+ start:37 stop:282 length:246 start_codon:yes stop_codon:yes gene_type:complete
MTEIEQELKELREQVNRLSDVVDSLTNLPKTKQTPNKYYLRRFDIFKNLYSSDENHTMVGMSDIMGVSLSTIKRYKRKLTN